MKRLKLRPYVLPTIYVIAIGTIIVSILLIGETIRNFKREGDVTYVVGTKVEDNSEPVIDTVPDKVIKPFVNESVKIEKDFYEKNSTEDRQKNSLIYYEGTYMQNSGVLYKGEEEFDVVSTMDGIITNIKEDNLLGIVIEIDHNSKLTTIYQSLKEAKVTVGASIKQGEIIGISGANNIDPTNKYELLFEVCWNGKLINPNNYYDTEIKTYEE